LKSIIWRKSWNGFIKNLNFFSTEERKTWTCWMTWGQVNYQQKFFFKSELLNQNLCWHPFKRPGPDWGS